jgi:hypothetical protein
MLRCIAIVAGVLSAVGVAPADPSSTGQELLLAVRKGRDALAEADGRAATYRCRYSFRSTFGKETSTERDFLVKRGDGRLLFETADGVCGLADEYAFALQRAKPGNEWHIALFSRSEREKLFDKVSSSRSMMFAPLTTFGGGVMRDGFIFSHPSTTFRNLKLFPDKKISADYSTQGSNTFGGPDRVLEGSVTFSPTHDYAVTQFETTFKNTKQPSWRSLHKREFIETSGPPLVKSFVSNSVELETGRVLQTEELTFSDYSDTPPAAQEFTLGHYGLPVPADDLSPGRFPRWVIGVGVATCLAVAYVGWRVVRRRRAAAR